jgi:hypothetical protein
MDFSKFGANADRYSFIATDSHRLLLAGLPAHNPLNLLTISYQALEFCSPESWAQNSHFSEMAGKSRTP